MQSLGHRHLICLLCWPFYRHARSADTIVPARTPPTHTQHNKYKITQIITKLTGMRVSCTPLLRVFIAQAAACADLMAYKWRGLSEPLNLGLTPTQRLVLDSMPALGEVHYLSVHDDNEDKCYLLVLFERLTAWLVLAVTHLYSLPEQLTPATPPASAASTGTSLSALCVFPSTFPWP